MRKLMICLLLSCMLSASLPSAVQAYYRTDAADQSIVITRLIVKLRPDVSVVLGHDKNGAGAIGEASFDAVNRKYAVRQQSWLFQAVREQCPTHPLRNVLVVEIPEGADLEQMITDYSSLDVVAYAHPDWPAELYQMPNDPLYPHQWALNNTGQGYYHVLRREGSYNDTLVLEYGTVDADIDFQEVYENPPDNTLTVVVAIIDTGVDPDHPDLAGRIWTNPAEIPDNGLDDDRNGYIDDVFGWDFCGNTGMPPFNGDNDPSDQHGHGTHCAGIVAGVTDNAEGIAGINSDVRIMALKFAPVMLSSFGAQAIVYAADNGADVISMSWGYPWQVQLLDDVLAYARSKGVILCAAAGNDGSEFSNYPAASPGVITVGATSSLDQVTTFSTYGEHLEIFAPGLSVLSLRAAGTDMYASHNEPNVHIIAENYYLASGTSMACPHVAGVAAFLRAVSPGLTPDTAQAILESTADDIVDPYGLGENYPGWDIYSGYGRVNLYQALNNAPAVRAKIESPLPNQLVSGTIDISGVADGSSFPGYVVEYGWGPTPTEWQQIYSSSSPVTGGTLAQWVTDTLDGQYTIRLQVGSANISSVTIYIANSTTATIATPAAGDTVVMAAIVSGTASAPDFGYYLAEYGAGISPSAWNTICQVDLPVVNGELIEWNTGGLDDGWYTLRLSVYSSGGSLSATDSVAVYVRSPFSGDNGWQLSFSGEPSVVINYGDFDDDGANEIVIATSDTLRFANPDGSPKTSGVPAVARYDFRIPPAVGDLDGDGVDDLVAVGIPIGGGTYAHLMGFPSTEPAFDIELTAYPPNLNNLWGDDYNAPYVSLRDIDGDGRDEVHYYPGSGTEHAYYVYNPDGSFRMGIPPASHPESDFYCSYVATDLDDDGTDELYFSFTSKYGADSIVSMVFQADLAGNVLDSFDLNMEPTDSFVVENLSAADMDGDGKLELIVFGFMNTSLGQWWTYAFDEDLVPKPGWPHNTGIDKFLIPAVPRFVDLDYDGSVEYVTTVYELSTSHVFAWRNAGAGYLGDSTQATLAMAPNPAKLYSPIMVDMDGDWYPDIVANAEPDIFCTYDQERILAWDRNGEVLSGWPLVTVSSICGGYQRQVPAAGDIDRDGYVDLVASTGDGKIIFLNFEGIYYHATAPMVPFWKYNRRMNSVGPVTDTGLICGDVDGNGIGPDVGDLTYLVAYIFQGGAPPPVLEMADVTEHDGINVGDLTCLVAYLFQGGAEPDCPTP